MKIRDMFKKGGRTVSFEFFPPKTEQAEQNLFEAVRQLKELKPSFVSVTYGAMGTTRAKTFELTQTIKFNLGIESMAHLTCVGHTREEMIQILADLKSRGLENVLALRGDPPQGSSQFVATAGGLSHSNELVSLIRQTHRDHFSIGGAGYPEGHVECKDKTVDLENLKRKVDAGAEFVITQLFFDNADFFQFRDRARKIGIGVPILAGIMPITNAKQIEKFTQMCGAKIPNSLRDGLQRVGDDQAGVEAFGVDYATRQCEELWKNGVEGLHFYTLNRSTASTQIYNRLGLGKALRS
jgi:methylenetetrahydrofolate reductase (NADPH)